MASVASQLIEEVTAHAQSDSLEDARQICADGTYFLNNLRTYTGRKTGLVCTMDNRRGQYVRILDDRLLQYVQGLNALILQYNTT